MIYEKFLMSAWIGDQSKLFGTSREPSERNFYVGISKVNNKIIRSFFTKILNTLDRTKLTYYLRTFEGIPLEFGSSNRHFYLG